MIRILIPFSLLFILIFSCSEKASDEKPVQNKRVSAEDLNAPDYDHIIAESRNDYPTTLRSDQNMLIYERMVLEIELDSMGGILIEGKPGSWENLEDELELFFNANRDLGNAQTQVAIKNKHYRFNNYPFYSYFTKESYQNFIGQLAKMATTDKTAKLYLQRHSRRIKAFEAVDDREIGFINPLAVIRYFGDENTSEEQFATLEKHLAMFIYNRRSELAYEKFGRNYDLIRRKAHTDNVARQQLLYLQEMYPAYFLRASGSFSDASDVTPPPPPMPTPPPVEEIIETENEPEIEMPN